MKAFFNKIWYKYLLQQWINGWIASRGMQIALTIRKAEVIKNYQNPYTVKFDFFSHQICFFWRQKLSKSIHTSHAIDNYSRSCKYFEAERTRINKLHSDLLKFFQDTIHRVYEGWRGCTPAWQTSLASSLHSYNSRRSENWKSAEVLCLYTPQVATTDKKHPNDSVDKSYNKKKKKGPCSTCKALIAGGESIPAYVIKNQHSDDCRIKQYSKNASTKNSKPSNSEGDIERVRSPNQASPWLRSR